MGLVQCLVIFWMFSAQLVLSSPLNDASHCELSEGRRCKKCPAGEYQRSCAECVSCPAGFYTSELNCEQTCLACNRDCSAESHLKVVQNCSRSSDMRCVCEEGFRCSHQLTKSRKCRDCEKIQETTTEPDKQTTSSASPGRSSTSTKPCTLPNCRPTPEPPAGNDPHIGGKSVRLEAILCPVALGCLALLILFFFHSNRDENAEESCFKRAIAKLCSEGGRDASHKPQESTHPPPRDSFSAKQPPAGLSAANQVPVHVYNPGTVIFGLLNQFTGQVGPTMVQCGKTAERVTSEKEEEEERGCPVFHPTSSPSIHLSEEERSGEADSIFFPSQEQGKECHVSKEESL
ncbi:uncharacterized protein si:dkey-260g12.1 [Trematomus bernacchii]|uniref:uncharacterized protein si:dkey-260g12.1 n=1 Tax=Trematomus bernacchii TaxID=40690 RepID=UPI00146EFFE6|nr:uncharacterized protein si:dkey-260g12.1 [Trematomus bernacchii]